MQSKRKGVGSRLMNSVLLLGGTGYIGEHLRSRLRQDGLHVRLLVRSSRDVDRLSAGGFECVIGDVLDFASLPNAMRGVDAVINLVAIIRERGGDVTFEKLNYLGTVNAIDAAHEARVRRFIQTSALGAANLPDFPYLFTKWRAENYVRESRLDWTIFRPSIIFGPSEEGHEHFVSQLADLVREVPLVPVVGGGSRFQPIAREDVSACFSRALADPGTVGRAFDLGGPDVLTYAEMLDEIATVLEVSKPRVNVPSQIALAGASIVERLPAVSLPASPDQLNMLQIDNTTPNNGAAELLDRALRPFRGNVGYVAQD